MEGKKKVQISQEAFDALVKENIEDFEMEPQEALEDAIQTFKLQGADLTGIVTNTSGGGGVTDHPVIKCLNDLREITASLGSPSLHESSAETHPSSQMANQEENINSKLTKIIEALDVLCLECTVGGSDNASIAARNGGIELVTFVCATLKSGNERALLSALKVLASLLRGTGIGVCFAFFALYWYIVLQCIDDSGKQKNRVLAKTSCSLLSQLAGSDANKDAIVFKGGITKIIRLSSIYIGDPSILQECMATIRALSLRSPANAAKAVEAGAADLAVEAMEKYPSAHLMQKQTCLMLRNLAVRNPENRPIMLEKGLEKLIRNAKTNHESCKDAATAALRDLGLDDYNV